MNAVFSEINNNGSSVVNIWTFYVFQWQLTLSSWKATSRSTSCPIWSRAPPTLWLCTPPKDPSPAAPSSPTFKHVSAHFIQLVPVQWEVRDSVVSFEASQQDTPPGPTGAFLCGMKIIFLCFAWVSWCWVSFTAKKKKYVKKEFSCHCPWPRTMAASHLLLK